MKTYLSLLSVSVLLLLSGCRLLYTIGAPLPTSMPLATDVAILATPTHTAVANATPMQTATPLPTAQLPPACTPRTDWQLYTVMRGDTLGSIARRTSSTVNELAIANCVANPNNITTGQQLRVPRIPATITPTLPPQRPLYNSNGKSTSFACAAFVNWDVAPLYDAPSATAASFADVGNWAELVQILGDFYAVNVWVDAQVVAAGFVRAADVTRGGALCDTLDPTATPEPADVWITQGSINISSYITADAGNYQLRAGETITLRWDDAPEALLRARFYTVSRSDGYRDEIGLDNDPQDGLAITWTVPATLDGHTLYAEGDAPNAAAFDYAKSYEQTVYAVTP